MQPEIITKKFLLVGLERQINFGSDFSKAMDDLRKTLIQNISQIRSVISPKRMVGFWQPGGFYFAGVEVSRIDSAEDAFVIKDLPVTLFAKFRENQRGTIGSPTGYAYSQWLPASDYLLNENLAGDFEIFDDMEHYSENDPCDIWIPIRQNADRK